MRYTSYTLTALIFLSSIFPSTYAATIDGEITLRRLALESESIIIGTPAFAENKISDRGNLYTEIVLTDIEALRDGEFQASRQEFVLYIWGGIRGADGRPANQSTPPPHYIDFVQGTPKLSANNTYLFFLSGNGVEALPFVESDLGAYSIGSDGVLTATEGEQLVLDTRSDSTVFVRKTVNRETPPVLLVTASEDDGVISVVPDIQNTEDVVVVDIEDVKRRISVIQRGYTDPIFSDSPKELSEIFSNENGRR